MYLPNDVVSQFVKATQDEPSVKKETTVFGTVKKIGENVYVQFDGSDILTRVSTNVNVEDDERVAVLIKHHSATITGNSSSPAARIGDVDAVTDNLKVNYLDANTLKAQYAQIDFANVDNAVIKTAHIEDMAVTNAKIARAAIEDVNIKNGTITNASIADATITEAKIDKAFVESLDNKYANIDFANIGSAAMEYFYANSGLIENVKVGDATITGRLVGVTIAGDRIEGNTVIADKLVILGEDGLYYKLNTNGMEIGAEQTEYNSLNGKIILAKSITATQISVDDLVAFDATIGGFHITDNSLYSGAKSSVNNTTRGIYLDSNAQIAIGDTGRYIKYSRQSNGTYKLEVRADEIIFGTTGKTVEQAIDEATSNLELDVHVSGRNLILNSGVEAYLDVTTDLEYELSSPLETGETYTLSMCITPSDILSDVLVYDQNLNREMCGFYFEDYDSRQVVKATFIPSADCDSYIYLRCSHTEPTMSESIIHWIKCEKGNVSTDWTPAPEDADIRITQVSNQIRTDMQTSIEQTSASIHETIVDQNTSVLQHCEDNLSQALVDYTRTGDFETFKETTESQLKILSDQLSFQVTNTQAQLAEVNGMLQSQLNTITKYFTFDVNGLTIGQANNPYKVIIDNDRYSMTVDGKEVLWIANGKTYTPDIEVAREFKLFGLSFTQDSSGNVNCSYVGGNA